MKSLSPALCLRASFGYYFNCSPRFHTPLSDLLYGHGLNLISKFAFVSGYAALRFCRYAQIPHKSFEPAHEQLLWTTTTTASALFSLLLLLLFLLLLLLFKRGCFGCRFTHQQIVEFIGQRELQHEGRRVHCIGLGAARHFQFCRCIGEACQFVEIVATGLNWQPTYPCPRTSCNASPNPNPNPTATATLTQRPAAEADLDCICQMPTTTYRLAHASLSRVTI